MPATKKILAFDLGAESGRGLVGAFDGERLALEVVHRFSNGPVQTLDALHWDVLRLYGEMLTGMRKAAAEHGTVASVGVDTWGVDFALLGRGGTLLGNPRHYRDPCTEGIMEQAFAKVPKAEIFRETGIQFMRFNTLFQLLALQRDRSPLLDMAETLLFIPDLFHYWLTGIKVNEYTDASTSQMIEPGTRTWARGLLARFGLPERILGSLVQPGTVLGPMRGSAGALTGLTGLPVIAPATHDTAAAVAAVPAVPAQGGSWAYLSSGTWSLMGVEIAQPLTHERAHAVNFTNEGGVGRSIRLLKNIMGLWLVQECRRAWERAGTDYSYDALMRLAAESPPFVSLVNPDDDAFILPANMATALSDYCRRTGQPVPESPGAVVRCALESLALKYRWVLERLEELTGRRLDTIHVVGGGSQNALLCQLTADACQRPVLAGPVEATATGNVLTQLLGLGLIQSLDEGRAVVRRSFEVKPYDPGRSEPWEEPYRRFLNFLVVIVLALLVTLPGFGGEQADAEWKGLATRAAKTDAEVDQLRQDLLAFRHGHPGTPEAMAAAGLLRELPSPLDKYDAGSINPLEKFPWQPQELVAILGEHRGRQAGPVSAVAYSRNGKMVVSGSSNLNGYVRFWDPATMRLQRSFAQPLGTHALAFSKDSTFLAAGGGDGHVRLWDVTMDPPKEKGALKVSSGVVYAVAVAPSGKLVAAGGADSRVGLWDLTEDPPRETSTGDGHTGAVRAVAFAPDGKTLATGAADKTIRLWSLKDNKLKEKAVIEGHSGGVLTLAFHPTDEKVLVSGGADGIIRFWNVAGGKLVPLGTFKSTGGAVHAAAFSLSGKTLATGHADGTCRTWTMGGVPGKEKALLEGHIKPVNAVAFSPDGITIVTGSADWTVRQWPAVSGPKPRDRTVTKGHLSDVRALNFAPDGKSLASGGQDQTIRIWDLAFPEPKERLPHAKSDVAVRIVIHAPDGKSVAAAGVAAAFRTYDTTTRRFIYTFNGHAGSVSGLAWAPDGSMIASAGGDKTLRLWNPQTGKEIYTFRGFESALHGVSFSPDGVYLLTAAGAFRADAKGRAVAKDSASVYQDSTARMYEVASKKEVFRWKDDKVLPQSAQFTPDGRHFVVATSDAWLRAWSWPEPEAADPVFIRGGLLLNESSYSPDGRYFVAVGGGGVGLFDAAKGKLLRQWILRERYASFAFATDSRHIVISLVTGPIYLLRLEEAGKK